MNGPLCVLLTLASMTLLLATVAGSLPLRGLFFDTAAHFMFQYLLSAIVLAVLACLLTPAPQLALASSVMALIIAGWQLAPFALPARPVAVQGSTVTILQSNMLFLNRNIDGLMGAIENHTPDIIVIAEANRGHVAYLRDIMRHYPYQASTPREHSFGMAIASRIPLTAITEHYFATPRIVAYSATLQLDGQDVTLLALHPANPLKNIALRDAELDAAGAWIAQQRTPVIVTGDFNITPYAQAYKDLIRATGLHNARTGRGLHGTFHSRLPAITRLPIDHTLYSAELAVADYKTIPVIHTDHLASVVTLGFAQK